MFKLNGTEFDIATFRMGAHAKGAGHAGAAAGGLEPASFRVSRDFGGAPAVDWFAAAAADPDSVNSAALEQEIRVAGNTASSFTVSEGTVVSWTLSQRRDSAIEETIELLARTLSMTTGDDTVEIDIDETET